MTKEKEPRLNVVVTPEFLVKLDKWRAKQGSPIPNRSEAARTLIERGCDQDLEEP